MDLKDDCITIRKLPQNRESSKDPTENPTREYTAVETTTPQFQELKKNLEKLTNKPKQEDLKTSKGPASSSVEKKEANASPNTDHGSKQASGGPRQSWVLGSSTPQTKAFDGVNGNLAESQRLDSDEHPQENTETPATKPSQDDDSKVYKIKDNPFIRGSTPTKNQPETRKSVTSSREAVVTKKVVEERQVTAKQETTTSSSTTVTHKAATQRYSVAPTSSKLQESDIRRSSVSNTSTGGAKSIEKPQPKEKEPAKKPTTTPTTTSATDRSKSKSTTEKPRGVKGSVADGWHSLEYENGKYEGDIKSNKRHGKGCYTWKDGNKYEGDWVDDLKEGTGRFVWTTGDSYEGEYKKDKRDGVGIKTYANGDKYEVC